MCVCVCVYVCVSLYVVGGGLQFCHVPFFLQLFYKGQIQEVRRRGSNLLSGAILK